MAKKKSKHKENAPTDIDTQRKVKNEAPSVGYSWFNGFFQNKAPATKEASKKKAR